MKRDCVYTGNNIERLMVHEGKMLAFKSFVDKIDKIAHS